ncbi:unnamed protein product [Dibothriocephalus latus]|uniref:Uncharacterized protein n=1 Tax=Dibothriocephalus latus TaxID=60516 RepID=A0A3P7P9U7_DIBLA|nr:unnamed protein product [Dibothriocephalus latus]
MAAKRTLSHEIDYYVNNSNDEPSRATWIATTSSTQRTMGQAIAVRVVNVAITLAMIIVAIFITKRLRDLYLFLFLLPLLAELCFAVRNVVLKNSEEPG